MLKNGQIYLKKSCGVLTPQILKFYFGIFQYLKGSIKFKENCKMIFSEMCECFFRKYYSSEH